MPQVVTAQVAPDQQVVVNLPPSGGYVGTGTARHFVKGGAAGWGQAYLALLADCFDDPRVPVTVRVAVLGNTGYRVIVSPDDVDGLLTLHPGSRAAYALQPGDTAVVVSHASYPVGVCVEYADAPAR